MSVELLVLVGLLCLAFILQARELYKGAKQKRFLYTLKREINNWRWGFTLIWMTYFGVGVGALMPAIKQWVEHAQSLANTDVGRILIGMYPLFITITFIIILFWVVQKVNEPFIKYNDKEKRWLDEDNQKMKATKLYKVLNRIFFLTRKDGRVG